MIVEIILLENSMKTPAHNMNPKMMNCGQLSGYEPHITTPNEHNSYNRRVRNRVGYA